MFRLLLQCWLFSFASLSFFLATSLPVKFLLQYNSVLKRLDQPPLLINVFSKNPGKKRRRSSATNQAMSLGCHENSDPENSDLRPQTPKTQTPKTQTPKTQTPKTRIPKAQTPKNYKKNRRVDQRV